MPFGACRTKRALPSSLYTPPKTPRKTPLLPQSSPIMPSDTENAQIDPLSSLLSPPPAKTTSPAIHAFFTPRQQRRVLNSITPNQSRVHLLSPEDSPSVSRASKRLRIDSSPIPASFDARVRSSTCQTEETISEEKAEEEELVLQPSRQRIRPNTRMRTLMRSLGGMDLGTRGYGVGPRGLHCAGTKIGGTTRKVVLNA